MKGIYSLIFRCNGKLKIGSIGKKEFNGVYAYVGSARGSGGLEKRVGRHLSLSKNKGDTRHWHIDYVLPKATILGYYYGETEKDKECVVAANVEAMNSIVGFGCSDCKCDSHLFKLGKNPRYSVKKAFLESNIEPHYEKVKKDEKE